MDYRDLASSQYLVGPSRLLGQLPKAPRYLFQGNSQARISNRLYMLYPTDQAPTSKYLTHLQLDLQEQHTTPRQALPHMRDMDCSCSISQCMKGKG
uniref:Uncharacterized protein n=1 Tax=Arundo donax TaxID=35708 RepID=A0A0A9CG81_ARUDO